MICCQFRNTLIVPNSIHEVVLVILYVWAEEVNFYLPPFPHLLGLAIIAFFSSSQIPGMAKPSWRIEFKRGKDHLYQLT